MTRYLHNSMILLVHSKRVFQRDLHDDEIEDEIREAFRCFDKEGHGFIPVTGTVLRLAIFKGSVQSFTCNFFDGTHKNICNNTHSQETIK